MPDDAHSFGSESGRQALAAIRSCLATFSQSHNFDEEQVGDLTAFVQDATPPQVYQAIAIAAMTIRWASHETGRSELEILDELGKNYGTE